MAAAVARARDGAGQPCFNVIGVDLSNAAGRDRIDAINAGRFPFTTVDQQLVEAVTLAHATGNLRATADPEVYAGADVIICDVNLDLQTTSDGPSLALEGLRKAVGAVAAHIRPGTLLLVETTTPPGTTERIVAPEMRAGLEARGLPGDAVLIAHSYERVMPGADYLDSIINYWRVYAGCTPEAADAAEAFLSRVINVAKYPLTRLASPTASETAKVLENSYRAVTIAFMEEWARFAENVGVDLFSVVDAIRKRPTHSNMRTPGFGVGGYCLTKDPLFATLASRDIFGDERDFPFCRQAVALNNAMPLVSVDRLERELGSLEGRSVLLLGISYRPDVGDTRYSPSETFVDAALGRGATITCHDPLVEEWPEMAGKVTVARTLPSPAGFDAVVFGVAHRAYQALDLPRWLSGACPLVLDANGVLSNAQRRAVRAAGCRCYSIGRGFEA